MAAFYSLSPNSSLRPQTIYTPGGVMEDDAVDVDVEWIMASNVALAM